ncbi:MAG: hypothetical protein HQ522_00755 [Bacteroidetes bacterium]|nr:hypothetical protein [Bacteroidota bacterium]
MKNITIRSILILLIFTSCSTGKKSLQKGDYFSAVSKSVQRLKSAPDNKKAVNVLKEGYQLTLNWSQEEMDMILSGNNSFKWENAIQLMKQVNNLARQIRQTPAARKIIADPKTYSSELNMAVEKAANERYNAGISELELNTQESARIAFNHFRIADRFIPEYKNVLEKLAEAKSLATINVVLEAIPVNTINYKLTSEFFYNQVFNYLNNKFAKESFVNFYSPNEAERVGLENPDYVVALQFFDFSVGNTVRREVEEQVKNRVKIESKDTTRVQYKNYEAKIKTFTDEVNSRGILDVKIIEFNGNKLMQNDRIPGSFKWINDYAIYVGDIEALNKKQIELTQKKAVPLPPKQDLFIEFTKPIYDQLTGKLNNFFRRYN